MTSADHSMVLFSIPWDSEYYRTLSLIQIGL
jgi:hypothetical protein